MDLQIFSASEEHADDWTMIFLKGMKSCKWMKRYLSRQNITEYDVKMSFLEDLKAKTSDEQLLIGYIDGFPAGIIRFDRYFISGTSKIISHFPLLHPRYQRKGIGRKLVKKGTMNAFENGIKEIWSESWALNKKEINIYQAFFEKMGFESKSYRLEMSCSTASFFEEKSEFNKDIEIISSNEISNDIVNLISQAYGNSKDLLHEIENLGDPLIAKSFLNRTKEIFESLGFEVNCLIAKYRDNLCAGLLTATTNNKGMILEIGVLPEYRGKRIAWQMISQYISRMKIRRISEVVLGVDEGNIPAIKLYKKLGFQRTCFGHLMLLVDKTKLGLNNDYEKS